MEVSTEPRAQMNRTTDNRTFWRLEAKRSQFVARYQVHFPTHIFCRSVSEQGVVCRIIYYSESEATFVTIDMYASTQERQAS